MTYATMAYVLGLLVEEAGEISQLAGKALRFGLDTPGRLDAAGNVSGDTPRTLMPGELGDMLAAIDFAILHNVFDVHAVRAARDKKLRKLLDPGAVDNLGRPLAPQPARSRRHFAVIGADLDDDTMDF